MRQQLKKVSKRDQLCILFTHDDFVQTKNGVEEPILLHAVKRFVRVDQEGPQDLFFDEVMDTAERNDQTEEPPPATPKEIMEMQKKSTLPDDAGVSLSHLVEVDDDNEPAPENVPDLADEGSTDHNIFGINIWKEAEFCARRTSGLGAGGGRVKATLQQFPSHLTPSPLQLFEMFFPKELVKKMELSLKYLL